MFDFKYWIGTFQEHYRQTGTPYNDAQSYDVVIESEENRLWRVLGIHHLLPHENRGNHNVYVEILCKQGERDGFRAIHWTWAGRGADENAPDAFAGQKPANELINIPLNLGMIISVWTNGGEVAAGFSSDHPEEGEEGHNTVGYHSFFVYFQEIDPDPDPEPSTQNIVLMIKKEWIDSFETDEDGYIRIYRGDISLIKRLP